LEYKSTDKKSNSSSKIKNQIQSRGFGTKIKNQGQLFSLRSKVNLHCRRFLASSERQNQVQNQKSNSSSISKIKSKQQT